MPMCRLAIVEPCDAQICSGIHKVDPKGPRVFYFLLEIEKRYLFEISKRSWFLLEWREKVNV